MNKLVSRTGAAILSASVLLFAAFLFADCKFAAYFVCMLLPIGYIMTAAGLRNESPDGRRVPADIGMTFAAIYAALIFIVYFAQMTSVRLETLTEQASMLLDYSRGGLMFGYDLLGYGMMALSTFFIGLSMKADNRRDKWLRALLMIHGAFFPGCFIMPMTGAFSGMSDGSTDKGGVIALLVWCAYFLPIGILAFFHFGEGTRGGEENTPPDSSDGTGTEDMA